MKKSIILSLLCVITLSMASCKNDKKQETKAPAAEKGFSVESKTTTINWTAYKTTAKVPVKGQFTEVTIENTKKGATAKEALDGLKFSIPIQSLFTKDSIRDNKLKKFFFGVMTNTSQITGTLYMRDDTSGNAEISMNGISQKLPITYTVKDQMVTIEAEMDLDNWQAQAAIEALNVVCKELHTGEDGVSKTWNEVKIEVVTYLKKE